MAIRPGTRGRAGLEVKNQPGRGAPKLPLAKRCRASKVAAELLPALVGELSLQAKG
jgi:hypothetical protein